MQCGGQIRESTGQTEKRRAPLTNVASLREYVHVQYTGVQRAKVKGEREKKLKRHCFRACLLFALGLLYTVTLTCCSF